MFFLYYFFYGTSFAKVPWVYNSEINSLGWRVRGAAAATATNWMGGFIVTQFTKIGADNLKWRFYLSMSPRSFFFPFWCKLVNRDVAKLTLWHCSLCRSLLRLLPRGLLPLPRDLSPYP